ncbi:MAG: MATE family efflux transporter, partial [Alphaproteobacteria bacterium]
LGIAGSALATLISGSVSVIALAAYINWRDLPIRLKGAELAFVRPDPALVRLIVGKGLPIGAQMLVISVASLAMIGLVNREGVATSAAYGVTLQLWAYAQMPALAVGAAVSAMAAQNIGANRWDRVAQITRAGLLYNLALTGVMIVAVLWFDRSTLGLFLSADSPAIPIAQRISMIATWSFLLFGATMVLFGTVRANGAVWGPLLILFTAMFPVRLGLALVLHKTMGADALWWSFPTGSAATLLGATLYYLYGPWRKTALLAPPPQQASQERGGLLTNDIRSAG